MLPRFHLYANQLQIHLISLLRRACCEMYCLRSFSAVKTESNHFNQKHSYQSAGINFGVKQIACSYYRYFLTTFFFIFDIQKDNAILLLHFPNIGLLQCCSETISYERNCQLITLQTHSDNSNLTNEVTKLICLLSSYLDFVFLFEYKYFVLPIFPFIAIRFDIK